MATDPIRSVREHEHDTVVDLDGDAALIRLAALPPSPAVPYLTVSLDWRPAGDDPGRAPAPKPRPSERRAGRDDVPDEGPSRRPSRRQFDQDVADLIARHGPRGDAFDSLSTDLERINAYLDEELDPAAHGVFIVACAAAGVFEPLALGLPMPTRVAAGPTPALLELARLVDDHPTYAVLLADQHDATLALVTQATHGRSVSLESSDYPRKQQQGGWSQRRFQARADERIAAFARGIADEVQRALDESAIDMLIVAGDEVITSALGEAFHPSVAERVVGTIPLDIRASEQDVIAATMPIAEEAERRREAEAVRALEDALGAGGAGAGGPEAVLAALQVGQVATLLMNDDFAAEGWADFVLPTSGVGPVPRDHPLGGNPGDLLPIAVEEEAIRLAAQTGAGIQIVRSAIPTGMAAEREIPEAGSEQPRTEAATVLDEHGGIGALLRFAIAEDQPVAVR